MNTPQIAITLPHRESFSPAACGAVALCAREYVAHSRFGGGIVVYGGSSAGGFVGVRYRKIDFDRAWYRSKTKAYCDALVETIKRERVGVVEINNRPVMAVYMLGRVSAPLVLYLHNDPQSMKGAKTPRQRRWLLDHCAAVFCNSAYVQDRFLDGLGGRADNLHLAYPGIELPRVDFHAKEKKFLYCGRMVEEKGSLVFAQALARVLPLLPDWSGVMVGARRQDSKGLSAYERKVVETIRPLGDKVAYLGFRSHAEVMDLFKKAEVAVAPALWDEPFGRTAVEALASGCALVCSDRGGLKEITQGAAVVCKDVNAENLAEAMLGLARDERYRSELQANGLKKAKDFSIEKSAREIDGLLDGIMRGRGI